eukprot:scaffold25338_cov64-Cyclotella_meneghiniana.AAC.2
MNSHPVALPWMDANTVAGSCSVVEFATAASTSERAVLCGAVTYGGLSWFWRKVWVRLDTCLMLMGWKSDAVGVWGVDDDSGEDTA